VVADHQAETLLITSLFPSAPPPDLLSLTLTTPLTLVNNTITPTISTIKRSPAAHAFVALDLYQSLTRLQSRWEPAVAKCLSMVDAPPSAQFLTSVLASHIATLRQLCVRSFPELLVDIRSASMQNNAPSSAISDTTYSTLTYIETLPAYEQTVEGLLGASQSQRSWLMGQKEAPSPVRSAEEEGGLVHLFVGESCGLGWAQQRADRVADVLGTLIIHLNQRSQSMRRPIGQTCLLTNRTLLR
jgi:exocyst complex protein 7